VTREGPFKLTAWAEEYFCVGPVDAEAGAIDVELLLVAHSDEDNPAYEWLPSRYHAGLGENQGCAECHSAGGGTALPFTLPVDEWQLDAHSQSATNPRFLTMYLGTDVNGNQSPMTRYGYSRDYSGCIPLECGHHRSDLEGCLPSVRPTPLHSDFFCDQLQQPVQALFALLRSAKRLE